MNQKERIECRDELLHYLELLKEDALALYDQHSGDSWRGEDDMGIEYVLNQMSTLAAKISYRARVIRDAIRYDEIQRINQEKIEKREAQQHAVSAKRKLTHRIKQEKAIVEKLEKELKSLP